MANPTNQKVSCSCGKLKGEAEVIAVPQKSRNNPKYQLGWKLTGHFYITKDDLICEVCHKPALIKAKEVEVMEVKGNVHLE